MLRKTFSASLSLLLVLLASSVWSPATSVKAKQSWIVDKNGAYDFENIGDAVAAAQPGDTIVVHNGTYYERLVINKSLSLIGSDRDYTIIDGNGTGSIIEVIADHVMIKNFTIRQSLLARSYGIHLDHSNGGIISHNRITYNYDGLVFHSSNDNLVSDNIILNNYNDGVGLYSSCINNTIVGNTVARNLNDGMKVHFSSANTVRSNTLSNNSLDGISLYSANNNVFSANTISFNSNDGIMFYSSSNNLVSDNIISSNYNDGITFYLYADNNTISGNTISSNFVNGMVLSSSSNNNVIYHNNFNNAYQVYLDSNCIEIWSLNGEGNYWSNYMGKDVTHDGIGDDPFSVNEKNEDTFPLAGVFSLFQTNLKGQKYFTSTICNSTISDFRFEIVPETGSKIVRFNVTGRDDTFGFCRIGISKKLMDTPFIVMVGYEEVNQTTLDGSNATFASLYFTYTHTSQIVRIVSSELLGSYYDLLAEVERLGGDLQGMNTSFASLLTNYTALLERYHMLNLSYQEHLANYGESLQNLRSLTYIFAFTTGVLLVALVYLSRRPRPSKASETRAHSATEK